ncbi:DUF4124 domain-containing protein [Stenotrophomonas sp. LARHCG68]
MYRGFFVFTLLAVAGSVSAQQQVYKCVNGKQVSYQSDPCPGQAVKAWDATPEPVRPYVDPRFEQRAQPEMAVSMPSRRSTSAPGGHSISIARDRDRCEQARAGRAAAYQRAGVSRGFELSSYWDNRVQDACK